MLLSIKQFPRVQKWLFSQISDSGRKAGAGFVVACVQQVGIEGHADVSQEGAAPFDFSQTVEVVTDDMKSTKPSPVSPMPAGMISRLNKEELKDLLAYLLGK